MHPRHLPFLRLFVPWAAGIAAGATWNRAVPGLAAGLLVAGLMLLLSARMRYAYALRWVYGLVLAGVLWGMGYWHAVQCDERQQTHHFSRQERPPAVFTGIIADAPSKGQRLKMLLRLETGGPSADSLRPCSGRLLLFLEPTADSEKLRYGDRIWVRAGIRAVEGPKNPQAFDYRRYLHFQNIHYLATVPDSAFGRLSSGHGHTLWRVAYRWRERLLAVLHEHFPGRDEYAVAAALLVGYKEDLSDELRASYAETGSMHALAVSGTHVGLLYLGLLFLLRRIPWRGAYRRWGETGLVLAGIWAFTFVTGATASVLRASVMFSAYLLGKAIRRQASIWNILGASAFGLLWLNPYFLFDAGFQLSYAAVAGIVYFYPQLKKITPPPLKWAAEGWKILLIGIAAQLGTLPLSLYYFHQFPVYFWLAGWVVVLGGAVFLWGGSVLVLLHELAPEPAAWLGAGLYHMLQAMNALIRGIQQLPGSVAPGIWLEAWVAVLLALMIFLAARALELKSAKSLLAALACLAALSAQQAFRRIDNMGQQHFTLYHTSRHFLLDIFDGERCYVWADSISARQEQSAAQAHRWARGCIGTMPLEEQRPRGPCYRSGPAARIFGKTLVVLHSPEQLQTGTAPLPVNALILHGNPRVRIRDCLERFPTALVVCTAGNSIRRVDRWKAECDSLRVACYNVRAQGAWVFP